MMDKINNRGILMNNNNKQKKSLIKVNENRIFYKIKKFFRNLFKKQEIKNTTSETFNKTENDTQRQKFLENIRNIENEEIKLLKLQRQYRNGEIKESDLTEVQYKSLCDLYDKQILNLRKSNEFRKQKILQYRKKLQKK